MQQAELALLERAKRQGSARVLFWMLLLALGVSLGLGLALYLMGRSTGLGDAELMARFQAFREYLTAANAALGILLLAAGPVLTLETLLLTSDSIAREQRAGAWATLVLTPLSAWQIVTGKWRAGQAYIYRHYRMIMGMRAVGFAWLAFTASLNTFSRNGPDLLALMLGVVMVVGFLALNLALAGALSLLASFQGGRFASFGGAVSLQFIAVLAAAAFNVVLLRPLFEVEAGDAFYAAVMMAIVPIDSGVMVASQLTAPFETSYSAVLALFALLNAGLLVGLSLAALRLARRLAIRQGAAA